MGVLGVLQAATNGGSIPNPPLFCDGGGRSDVEAASGKTLAQAAAAPSCSEPCLLSRAAVTVLGRSERG